MAHPTRFTRAQLIATIILLTSLPLLATRNSNRSDLENISPETQHQILVWHTICYESHNEEAVSYCNLSPTSDPLLSKNFFLLTNESDTIELRLNEKYWCFRTAAYHFSSLAALRRTACTSDAFIAWLDDQHQELSALLLRDSNGMPLAHDLEALAQLLNFCILHTQSADQLPTDCDTHCNKR